MTKWLFGAIFSMTLSAIGAERTLVTSAEDSGPGTLRAALAAGASEIEFLTSSTITLATPLPAVNNALIIGNPASPIKFRGAANLLEVSGSLVLSNVTFKDCFIDGAAVITNRGSLTLVGCRFDTCISTNAVGGIVSSVGTLRATNTVFWGNWTFGLPSPSPSTYPFGRPAYGGAVRQAGGRCVFHECLFRGNYAFGGPRGYVVWSPLTGADGASYGAGLYATSSVVTIKDTEFAANRIGAEDRYADAVQGAGAHLVGSQASICGGRFIGNLAQGPFNSDPIEGGGLYALRSRLEMDGCLFQRNSAIRSPSNQYRSVGSAGGGLFAVGPETRLRNCVFLENVAEASSDIAGPITSLGGNIVESPGSAGPFVASDIVPDLDLLSHPAAFSHVRPTSALEPKWIGRGPDAVYIVANDPAARAFFLCKLGDSGEIISQVKMGDGSIDSIPGGGFRAGRIVIYSILAGVGAKRIAQRIDGTFEQSPGSWTVPHILENGEFIGDTRTFYRDGTQVFSLPATAQSSSFRPDDEGNLYVAGAISSPFTFPGTSITINGGFLIKVRPDGTPVWHIPLRGESWNSEQLSVFAVNEKMLWVGWQHVVGGVPTYRLLRINPSLGTIELNKQINYPNLLLNEQKDSLVLVSRDSIFPSAESTFSQPLSETVNELFVYGVDLDLQPLWIAKTLNAFTASYTLDAEGHLRIAGRIGRTSPFGEGFFCGWFNNAYYDFTGGYVAKVAAPHRAFIYATLRSGQVEFAWDNSVRHVLQKAIFGESLRWETLKDSRSDDLRAIYRPPQAEASGIFRLTRE